MSKHQELCEAYRNSRNTFREYDLECNQFAKRLKNEFVSYLECTNKEVRLDLTDAKMEESYYKFKMGVLLYINGPTSHPQREIVFHIWIKKQENVWMIKLPEDDAITTVGADLSGITTFFDSLFQLVQDSHENALKNFLDETKPTRKIGFAFRDND